MPLVQQPGGKTFRRRHHRRQDVIQPDNSGATFGSGIRPRCSMTGLTGHGVPMISVSPTLTGWTNAGLGVPGESPQPGDLVIMVASVFKTADAFTQTAGTGTWTRQSDVDSTFTPTASSFIFWRIFDGTETTPTFTGASTARIAFSLVAIAPDAGSTIAIDSWATELVDTASTTHSINAATAAGTGELSLILANFFVAAANADPLTVTDPAGYGGLQTVNEAGLISTQHDQATHIAFSTGVGSGSISPGTITVSSSATSIIDHVLISQSSAGGTLTGVATLSGVGSLNASWPRFSDIGLNGVGTVNTMADNGAGVLVMGADTHGYYRSIDYGDHWQCIDRGVGGVGVSDSFRQSASIVWSVTETNTLYSGVGEAAIGNDGGLLVSNDGGISWNLRTSFPQFAGNHELAPLPTGGTPRSTGRLLAQDGGFLFAATYNQGVLRSANNGTDNFPVACTMAGVAPGTNYFARSILADPANPGTMYVAMYDYNGTGTFGHVWKCTADGATTPNFVKLAASPASVEELVLVGGVLYAVAGSAGVFRSTDGGTTWTNLNGSGVPTAGGQDWFSVDGYVDGSGNHVIYICDTNPAVASQCVISLVIPSTWPGSGSITYNNETGSVQLTNLPPDNRSWWNTGGACLGRTSWQNGHVAVDASDLANVKVYAFGPAGFFRNINGTGWTIASNGQPGFPARSVACDPRDANHFQLTSTDWGTHDISDGIAHDATTTLHIASPGAGPQGYGVSFDPTDSTVYTAFGDKGVAPTWGTNSNGSIAWRATGSTSWTIDGPSVAGKVALGICGLRDGSGTKILLAAVWNSGIWRGVWGGSSFTWTQVSSAFCNTAASPGGGNQFILAHPAGSQYVYIFDPAKGVYRSNDYGVTWVQVYAVTTTDKNSLAVAASETTAGEIYLTANGSLYKITNAHTGTVAGSTATLIGPISLPGSAHAGCLTAKSDGTIYVSTEDVPGSLGTQIFASGDHGSTWVDVIGDGSLSMANSRPVQMVIAADGRLYLAGSNVVTQGYPLTVPTAVFLNDSGSASDTLATTATRSLSDSGSGTDSLAVTVTTPLTDSGAGSSTLTTTAAIPLTDSAAGTDSLAVTTTTLATLSDSGTAADTLASAAAIPLTDSATAADVLVTAHALSDSGSASDTLASTATIALADAGAATDALALTVALPDQGTATDALTLNATAQLSDTATATDAVVVRNSLADSGTANDALTAGQQTILSDSGTASDSLALANQLSDTATSTDSLASTAAIALSDTGAGSDALSVATGNTPTLNDSGTGTDTLAVQVSISDSGIGSETITSSANVQVNDSGTAADSFSLVVALRDSGTVADTIAVPAAIALTDSGTGADSMIAGAGTPIPLTDSGTGTDSLTTPASIPLAESAAGSDTVVIAFAVADSGTGADSLTAGQQTLFSDSGTGADSLAVNVALTETGTASDALTATAAVVFTETGSGSDSLKIAVALAETATGADSLAVVVSVPLADSGAVTDALSVAQGSTPSLLDAGTGADVLSLVSATAGLADSGTGSDSLSVGINFTETATATDAFVLNAIATLTDTGSGTSVLNITTTLVLTDSASGSDALTLRILSAVVITDGLGGMISTDGTGGSITHDFAGGTISTTNSPGGALV